jgi:glycosyltransferase involved in cell wall biosynthesis
LDIRSTPVEPDNFQGSLRTLRFNTSVAIAKKVFDGMTTLTDLMKQEICNKFYIDPRFIGVWTSGVSTALFKPENYDGVEIRKKLGLINKFIVFYHGSLSLYRGIEESIESIRILKKECDDIVLFLLGKSPRARDLLVIKELIQKSEVQDNVIIHSAVCYEDVPKYISMCDVGIVPLPDLPYWRYQCPLKLLEYLAMKKVVIVTDIPANREVIGESKCGIYVSSLDPEKIANAITYAYDNRDKLKEWGSDGRVIVEEKYSRNEVAKDLESFLLKG